KEQRTVSRGLRAEASAERAARPTPPRPSPLRSRRGGRASSFAITREDAILDWIATKPAEDHDADRGEDAGDDECQHAAARPVEVAECAGARSECDEDQPRQHDDGLGVDAHLETLGFELVEQLEITRGCVDEVMED